jgi:hypothetical protein
MNTIFKACKKYPSMWIIPYLILWLVAFSLWNRLSNIQSLTTLQSFVSIIYILIFVWIIQCPRTLWMILGIFYIIILLRYIYSAWFYKKTIEGFETAAKSTAPASSTPIASTTPTESSTNPEKTVTAPNGIAVTKVETIMNTIPITKETMNGAQIAEVDEWSDADKRKAEGLTSMGQIQAEDQKEKQRAGITFTSAATAQQETYKLIDAVQQLQEVMTNLSPTLREGKKIMDMFEKFQIKK